MRQFPVQFFFRSHIHLVLSGKSLRHCRAAVGKSNRGAKVLICRLVSGRGKPCHKISHCHLPRAERCVCMRSDCGLMGLRPLSRWVREWVRKWVWKLVRGRDRGMFQITPKTIIPVGVLCSQQTLRGIQLCVYLIYIAAATATLFEMASLSYRTIELAPPPAFWPVSSRSS